MLLQSTNQDEADDERDTEDSVVPDEELGESQLGQVLASGHDAIVSRVRRPTHVQHNARSASLAPTLMGMHLLPVI
jgi:hypothetical protein